VNKIAGGGLEGGDPWPNPGTVAPPKGSRLSEESRSGASFPCPALVSFPDSQMVLSPAGRYRFFLTQLSEIRYMYRRI
jgi:hypothetical protein